MPRYVRGPDGVVRRFPDDATDAEISAALQAPPPTARGAVRQQSWTDMAVEALPAAGGALGGVVGGIGGTVAGMGVGGVPGALGGAAVGGAAGEALRQLITRARGGDAPATPLEAARGIGREAAIQGASELVGQGVMKGATMAGHGLMDFAIRPAPTVAEEFGDIAATAVKERIPVGSVLPKSAPGSAKARAAMRESGATTRRLLANAEAQGVRFSPADVARGPVTELVGNIAKQPLSESELNQVSRLFAEYVNTQPGQMTPNGLKDMKQAAQRIAKPIFRALNQGGAVPAGESLKANFNKAVADGAKVALETIPEVAESEARTQGLIGTVKAVRRAERRRLPLIAETAAPLAGAMVGGAHALTAGDYGGSAEGATKGIGAVLLTRALLSSRSTSRMALGLTEPAIKETLRQLPRGAVYAMLAELHGAEDGEQ